jgi:outer membrane receptor protein involved in Fe transport
MGFRVTALAVLLLLPLTLHAQEPAAEPEAEHFYTPAKTTVTVGVLEFVSKGGISQQKADALADLLAEEISRMGDVRVIGKHDIVSILKLEKQKRLAGCDDSECISDVAGALGVRWMVSGSVSRFGGTYLLNLKLFDIERSQVVSRASRKTRGEEDILLSEIVSAAHELFARVGEQIGLSMPGTVSIAARHYQPLEQSPSAVAVLTREDIEASGAETISGVLRMVPGIDVVVSNQLQTSISARLGWNDENFYFLVLIDGREANLEVLGQAPLEAQPISLEDIERIEVIRGPASSLYGANALAGVVSIETRAISERTSGWARLSTGEVGRVFAGARASTRLGKWGVSVSGGADVAGSFNDHRKLGREVYKLRTVAEHRWSNTRRLLIDAGFSRAEGMLSASVGMMHSITEIRMLRLSYHSEDIRGHLYWTQIPSSVQMDAPLDFAGIRLANFVPVEFDAHTVNLEVQWTLPEFFEPLMIIAGGTGRVSWVGSDHLLNAETYADIKSSDYHQPGISHWEGRGGAFVHAELSPIDWVTVTGDLRFDYNTVTEEFFSPRLAAVFRPEDGHFLRMGVARAFRKPNFLETHTHLNVDFPGESPITGDAQNNFREFMTRGIGNTRLDNEELLSFEAGYLGQFLDKRLSVSLDVYYNRFTHVIGILEEIYLTPEGLPDIDRSSFLFENKPEHDKNIIGSELAVRYNPTGNLSLLASWTHREVFAMRQRPAGWNNMSPKNLITLGARFNTDSGLIGSLYAFSRSKFIAGGVPNPGGLLEKSLKSEMHNVILFLGKIGWRVGLPRGIALETGLKLFLPFSPFASPYFRYNEVGGVMTSTGRLYGGDLLSQMVTAYLQGSF